MENNIKRERLKEFYFKIKDCQLCELYKSRTNFVFGSGNANSSVIFIGEAPGKNEDIQGKPFVGQAGKLLDELLFSIELERSEIFIANILKCRPPGNRDPRIEEINICKNHLFKQIEIIDPKKEGTFPWIEGWVKNIKEILRKRLIQRIKEPIDIPIIEQEIEKVKEKILEEVPQLSHEDREKLNELNDKIQALLKTKKIRYWIKDKKTDKIAKELKKQLN